MAHHIAAQYGLLQRRYREMVSSAPEAPVFLKILMLLFSPEEAELARQIPSSPTRLDTLAARVRLPARELERRLEELAHRGLMFDLLLDGERYFALPPVVLGFYEMVFMRLRPELPQAELARLFEEFMIGTAEFPTVAFEGTTQFGRAMVREETIAGADHAEILDWERASLVVREASSVAVGICPCRHRKSHLGLACANPQRACLSLGYAADSLVRAGLAERLEPGAAMDILEDCKQRGLVQIADNVQRRMTFLCNCCGCCCSMLEAMRKYDIRTAVVSSNWIVELDPGRCAGRGDCVIACPTKAFELASAAPGEASVKRAVLTEDLCIGCGVCISGCTEGALRMRPRAGRVFYPETVYEKMAARAIERGKLAELMFDDPGSLTHRALACLVKVLERSTPFRSAMAIESLKSVFLKAVAQGGRRKNGNLAAVFDDRHPGR